MQQALSIVGYKKSGKTTLMLQLLEELSKRDIRASTAKFSHHTFDKENSDTFKFTKMSADTAALNENETLFMWPGKKYLPDLLPLMKGDVLLIEGGKSLTWLPRILILKDPEDAVKLDNGLALATWGKVTHPGIPSINNIQDLADLLLEKGFILPGLDCGSCDHETCLELARQIVRGQATPSECLAKDTAMTVRINNQPLAMNPFVEKIISKAITGMISELKGYSPGQVEIIIK